MKNKHRRTPEQDLATHVHHSNDTNPQNDELNHDLQDELALELSQRNDLLIEAVYEDPANDIPWESSQPSQHTAPTTTNNSYYDDDLSIDQYTAYYNITEAGPPAQQINNTPTRPWTRSIRVQGHVAAANGHGSGSLYLDT